MEIIRKMYDSVVLPIELVIMILLRLPVKSLARFKSVSNSWHSVISDPQFAKSQFELAASSTERLLLFSQYYRKIVSVDFNAESLHDESASSSTNLNFRLPKRAQFPIRIGSCRGLLLLECPPNYLFIWNPRTGFLEQLPSSPIYSKDYSFLIGFGYDPSTDDYLVTLATREQIKLIEFYDSEDEEDDDFEETQGLQIFSSRANTWQAFEGSQSSYVNVNVSYSSHIGLPFNGAIHWLARRRNDDNDGSRSADIIVVFDLVERVFSEIAVPNDFNCNIYFCRLWILEGCLGICDSRYNDNAGGIWVMEQYKIHSSWARRPVILPPSNIPAPSDRFSPICFTANHDMVGLDSLTELVKFNDQGQVLERRRYCDHQVDCNCLLIPAMLTESLLSITGDY